MADIVLDPSKIRPIPLDPSKLNSAGPTTITLDPSKIHPIQLDPNLLGGAPQDNRLPIVPFGESSVVNGLYNDFEDGVHSIRDGVKRMFQPNKGDTAEGIHQTLGGAAQIVSKPALTIGLIADAPGTLTGLLAGTLGQYATTKGLNSLGVNPGYSNLAGDAVGLVTGKYGGQYAPKKIGLDMKPSQVALARKDLNIPLEFDTSGGWGLRVLKRFLTNRLFGREPIFNSLQDVNTGAQNAAANIGERLGPEAAPGDIGRTASGELSDLDRFASKKIQTDLDSQFRAETDTHFHNIDRLKSAESRILQGLGATLDNIGPATDPEVAGRTVQGAVKSPIGETIAPHDVDQIAAEKLRNNLKQHNDNADENYTKFRSLADQNAVPVEVKPATTVPGGVQEVLQSSTPQQQAPGTWTTGTRNFQQDMVNVPAVTENQAFPVDIEAPVKSQLRPIYDKLNKLPDSVKFADPGFQVLDDIMKYPDRIGAVEAEHINGLMKGIAQDAEHPLLRERFEGIAAKASANLQSAIDEAIGQTSPEAQQALRAGRKSTAMKYQTRDLMKKLGYDFKTEDWNGSPTQRILSSRNNLVDRVLTEVPDLRQPLSQALLQQVGDAASPATKYLTGTPRFIKDALLDPGQDQAIAQHLQSPAASIMNVLPEQVGDSLFKPGMPTPAAQAVSYIGDKSPEALAAIRRARLGGLLEDSMGSDGSIDGQKLLNGWNSLGEGVQRSVAGDARDALHNQIGDLATVHGALKSLPPEPTRAMANVPLSPVEAQLRSLAYKNPRGLVSEMLKPGNDDIVGEAQRTLTPETFNTLRRSAWDELIRRNSGNAVGEGGSPVLNVKNMSKEWRDLSPAVQRQIAGEAAPLVNKLMVAMKDADSHKLDNIHNAIYGSMLDPQAVFASLLIKGVQAKMTTLALVSSPRFLGKLLTSPKAVQILNEGLELRRNNPEKAAAWFGAVRAIAGQPDNNQQQANQTQP